MKKYSFRSNVLCVLLCLLSAGPLAAEAVATPEATVAAFYKWFMLHDNDQTYPLREPAIYNYVEANTVDKLNAQYASGGVPGDVDYFLKVQDYDGKDWVTHITPHPATLIGDKAVVVASFGSKALINVVVVLHRANKQWKIIKVLDTLDY